MHLLGVNIKPFVLKTFVILKKKGHQRTHMTV